MENYKSQLNVTSGYPNINSAQIFDTYLNGSELEVFNVMFNSIAYNSEYCEKADNFLQLYKKYPDNKVLFTKHILENTSTYHWVYKDEQASKLLSSEDFEKFWKFPLHENTPALFSLIPHLDAESLKLIISESFLHSSLLKRAISNNENIDLEKFFTPYKIKEYPQYSDNKKNYNEIEIQLIDHILISLIQNKNYDLLSSYLINLYHSDYTHKISSYEQYDFIEELNVVNIKEYDANKSLSEQRKCSSLRSLIFSLSIENPQLLTASNLLNYYDLGANYSEWVGAFVDIHPYVNKSSMSLFDKFCQICISDKEITENPEIINKIAIPLLKNSDSGYLHKFLKTVMKTTFNKFIFNNIDSFEWNDVLINNKNKTLVDILIKNDEKFIFNMELSDSPYPSHMVLHSIHASYSDHIDELNKEAEKNGNDFKYTYKKPMNGEFIRDFLGEQYTDKKIFEMLLDKPFNKKIRELGYTSNLHYIMAMSSSSSLTYFINDIFKKNIPQLTSFNLQLADIDEKLSYIHTLENILEKTLFLPLCEHAKQSLQSKCNRKDEYIGVEKQTSEQMANLFHIQNGKSFINIVPDFHYETSNSYLLAEILPTYITILNNLSKEDFADKNFILSQYSINILNFFSNSLNGFSLVQNYSQYSYSGGENFNFIRDCFEFITQSGIYTEKEILNCVEQIKNSSIFKYYEGDIEIPSKQMHYLSQDDLKFVVSEITNLFIDIENTYLDLSIPIKEHENKKIKF